MSTLLIEEGVLLSKVFATSVDVDGCQRIDEQALEFTGSGILSKISVGDVGEAFTIDVNRPDPLFEIAMLPEYRQPIPVVGLRLAQPMARVADVDELFDHRDELPVALPKGL